MLLAACALLTVASMALILTFGQGRDQGIYNVVARTVLEGGMPYRDAWDFKTPGIYLVYALARLLFGSAEWGIRGIEVIGLGATVAVMTELSRRWWGTRSIGLMAGAMTALIHAQLDFWHTGQPETFAGMLTMAALWLGSGPRQRPLSLLASGVLFGAAGLLKPPLAAGAVVLALWLGTRKVEPESTAAAAPSGLQRGGRAALWLLLGGLVSGGGCLAWFALRGALPALYDTLLRFVPHYTALGWERQSLAGLAVQALGHFWLDYSALVGVGLLLVLASGRALRHAPATGLLAGVLATQLFGVALQAKFFAYHFAACWPTAALLAAWGWWRLWRLALAHGPVATVAVTLALVGCTLLRTATGHDLEASFWQRSAWRTQLFLLGPRDQRSIDVLATVADVDAEANRRVALELRRRVPPQGSLFIWGFEPVLYDLSGCRQASPYIYNVPQRVPWAAAEARARLLEDLRAGPPDALVVVHGDPMPMVTGDEMDSAGALARFAELDAFVDEHYGRLARIQDFDIYVLR